MEHLPPGADRPLYPERSGRCANGAVVARVLRAGPADSVRVAAQLIGAPRLTRSGAQVLARWARAVLAGDIPGGWVHPQMTPQRARRRALDTAEDVLAWLASREAAGHAAPSQGHQ